MSAADLDPFEAVKLAPERPPSEHVSARIKAECTQGLAPCRSLSIHQRLLLTALVAGVGACAIVGLSGAMSRAHQQIESAFFGTLAWAVVLSVVLALGLARPPGKRATSRTRLLIAASVPAMFMVYLGLSAANMLPVGQVVADENTLACGLHTLLCSSAVCLGIMLPWRRTDPFNPGLTGALLGLGGGLLAALAMGVVCPSREGWHLCLSHGLVLMLVVGVGALVGRRWLAP